MSFARRKSELSSAPLAPNPTPSVIERGRQVLREELLAIERLIAGLDDSFTRAVDCVLACRGSINICGMGKAGLIGQKLTATFNSTGTPSHFLHPAEAVHGDLGCVRPDDLMLFLSYSGETEEVLRLLPITDKLAKYNLAITSHAESSLARAVDVPLLLGSQAEACHMGLAPSCSTTAMLAMGDALALVVSQQRGFTRDQFAQLHPAGNLGKRLARVEEVMRPLAECRLAGEWLSVREVLIHVGRPGRRTGAIMLTDAHGELSGIFTDSDLARLLETAHESQLDQPIAEVMTRQVRTVRSGAFLSDAMRTLAQKKISELPVVSHDHRPMGLIDVTDVMSVISADWSSDDEIASPKILPIEDYRN